MVLILRRRPRPRFRPKADVEMPMSWVEMAGVSTTQEQVIAPGLTAGKSRVATDNMGIGRRGGASVCPVRVAPSGGASVFLLSAVGRASPRDSSEIVMLPFIGPSGLDLDPFTLCKRFKFFCVGACKLADCTGLTGRKTFKFELDRQVEGANINAIA